MKNNQKILIACYCEPQKPNLCWQLHTLYASFLANKKENIDFLVTIPTGTEIFLNPHIPYRIINPISEEFIHPSLEKYNFHGYNYINQCLATQDIPDRYDWVLRTDCDTIITEKFKTFTPKKFTVSKGGYITDFTINQLKKFCDKYGYHKYGKWHNIGSTWYGQTSLIKELSKKQIELTKQIIFDGNWETNEWPKWYAPVASMYSGEILINEYVEDIDIIPELLDGPVGKEKTNSIHLHMWHTTEWKTHFSKHAYEEGKYDKKTPPFTGNAKILFDFVKKGKKLTPKQPKKLEIPTTLNYNTTYKPIILFLFHENFDLCKENLTIIKYFNHDIPIYGLYGGSINDFNKAQEYFKNEFIQLHSMDNDNIYTKWAFNDYFVTQWYKEFGKALDFTHILLWEYDMLIFQSIKDFFGYTDQNTIKLTALKIVPNNYQWISGKHEEEYQQLKQFLTKHKPLPSNFANWACIFFGTYLTKKFLEQYTQSNIPNICNNEIKTCTFAQIYGFNMQHNKILLDPIGTNPKQDICQHHMADISIDTIKSELQNSEGYRIFHPKKSNFNAQELLDVINKKNKIGKEVIKYKGIKTIPEKDKHKVSIILPVKNEGALLQMTILSILHNTDYHDFEIIICDQGSTDGCCNFLQWDNFKHYSNIQYIDCKISKGVSETRNIGARNAKGKYLIYIDSHSIVELNWIEKFIKGYVNFDKVGLVGGNIPDINNWNTKNHKYVYSIKNLDLHSTQPFAQEKDLIDNIYIEAPNIPSGAMFMTKDFFEYSGGFDEGMIGWGFEDIEISMRTWLLGYRCITITDLYIYHYYKFGPVTYEKKSTDYEYNRLRLLFTNFQTPNYQKKILEHIKNTQVFSEVLSKIISDTNYKIYQQSQQHKFVHNDQWWINKFKPYLGQDFQDFEPMNLKSNNLNKKILVYTCAFYPNEEPIKICIESANKYNIDIKLYGIGKKFTNFFDTKLLGMYEFLQKHTDEYEYALFVDSRDIFFTAPLNEIFDEYMKFEKDFVISAETNIYPVEDLLNQYPPSPTRFRFVNSGSFIGKTSFILEKLKIIIEKYNSRKDICDQEAWTRLFLETNSNITLDYNCKLFQTIFGIENNNILSIRNKKIINKETNSAPKILHFNGYTKTSSYEKCYHNFINAPNIGEYNLF